MSSASFAVNTLPGGGIARGSIFTIFGRALGPATGSQVAAFPLLPRFAGVSIAVRAGTQVLAAIPIFVVESQINAIMPSNTPVGDVSLQVTYNGQSGNWVPVRVVNHAPGIFTSTGAGRGWASFLNFVSATDQPLNSGTNAIRPGGLGTLWLTGTGAIAAPDGDSPPVGDLPYNIEIFVGGRPVTRRLYAGRAPMISGLDQFVFYLPDDVPTGCFVPVYVRVNGAVSNATTLAVMPQGGRCADAHNPISAALIQGGKIVHGVLYRGTTSAKEFLGVDVDVTADKAAIRAMEETPSPFAFDPFLAAPPPGTCTSYSMRGNILKTGFQMSSGGRPLALGELSVSGGSGTRPVSGLAPGLFNAVLGGGYPSALSLFFGSGPFSLGASGGADGRAFTTTVAGGASLEGFDQPRSIDRGSRLNVTWRPQAGVSALLIGAAYDQPANQSALFFCVSTAGASSLAVPDYVLFNLPVSRGAPGQSQARLFLSAMPVLRENLTPDQVRVFTARQDVTVRAIESIR